jgi:hypothetical protein
VYHHVKICGYFYFFDMEQIILTQLFLELQQAASDAVLQKKVAAPRNVTIALLEPSEETCSVSRYVVTYHQDLPGQVNPWFSTTSLLEAAARAHLIVTGGLY